MAERSTVIDRLAELQKEHADLQLGGQSVRDHMVGRIYTQASQVAASAAAGPAGRRRSDWTVKLDDLLTSKAFGLPAMALLLGIVFWITIVGANIPSAWLGKVLFALQDQLTAWASALGVPAWIHGLVVLGMYRSLAWVVSVMLPPMAIFFPLFTLLEDLGYLPRVAFNLDKLFRRAGAHGKQALTMCMGFGCNAAGIIACRVIDSPRERLIAMLTNVFVPCNGRFPTLIALAAIFFGGAGAPGNPLLGAAIATATVLGLVVLGIMVTLWVSGALSRTVLKGVPSAFVLELPPYRRPQVLRVVLRSVFDRTLFVLARAVMIAAPAGALVWVLANTTIAGQSILAHLGSLLGPLGWLLGMDGFILAAFILGLPANEIVIPILLMSYLSTGVLTEVEGLDALRQVLVANGWTTLTALCVMLFSLLHFPCGTTLLTVLKETSSRRWTLLAAAIPTAVAIAVCTVVALVGRVLAALF